ncbi:MAG TPA: hypothetical protein DEA43_00280 [Candidatus Moranbacteria bacterium]|nr:hypothetical protein [Candidatus Moranbacteria bacterium]HBT45308.1 hypothetical protein [Candidatus Moranbacteria bacterium]
MENDVKKILIALYYYHPYVSGVSVYAKRLAEGLAANGFDVTILTTQFKKRLPAQETINGVNIVRCPVLFKLGKGVISPFFLLKIISFSKNYNIVNMHLPLAESGIASLFIPKQKMITTYHCDINLGKKIISKFIEKLSFISMHIALKRSRAIITQNIDYFLHSKMATYTEKAVEIIPPIFTEEYTRDDNIEFLKNKFDLKNEFIIGFVGRIVYEKGIKYLLESIEYLIPHISKFKIVLAGDYKNVAGGSVKNELDSFIKKYPNKVIFTGFLSDEEMIPFYSLINVLVLPSIDPLEAFGMVQVEAMSCGTPVIASNLPGVNSIIKKTGFGFISEPGNPKDIAEKIIKVYKKEYTSIGFKKEEWDAKNVIKKYSTIFIQGTLKEKNK